MAEEVEEKKVVKLEGVSGKWVEESQTFGISAYVRNGKGKLVHFTCKPDLKVYTMIPKPGEPLVSDYEYVEASYVAMPEVNEARITVEVNGVSKSVTVKRETK